MIDLIMWNSVGALWSLAVKTLVGFARLPIYTKSA